MAYNGGTLTTSYNLYGLPLGLTYTLNCGGGNDNIYAYPRDASGNSTFLTRMVITGGAGFNNVALDDSASTIASLYDFESGNGATNVSVGASLFTMNATIASLFIYAGSGNDQFDVNNISYLSGLNIHGNDGDDSINIAPASQNVYANIAPIAFSFDGGNGQDRMSFNNLHAPNAWTETMTNTRLSVAQNGASLRYNFDYAAIETIYSTGAALADTFNLASQAVGSLWQIDGGPGLDTVLLQTGNAAFMSTQDLGGLSMLNDAFASIGAVGATLITQSLSLGGNNTLDLNHGNLIYDYTGASPIATVQSLIRTGRAGGAWTGKGITSTFARNANPKITTLAPMEASDYKSIYGSSATFANFAIDSTAVLVKYTYYGDTDFNGKINFDDYSRIDSGFNQHLTGWLHGDFDGNGKIDFDDYALIDLAFNTQDAGSSAPISTRPAGRAPALKPVGIVAAANRAVARRRLL